MIEQYPKSGSEYADGKEYNEQTTEADGWLENESGSKRKALLRVLLPTALLTGGVALAAAGGYGLHDVIHTVQQQFDHIKEVPNFPLAPENGDQTQQIGTAFVRGVITPEELSAAIRHGAIVSLELFSGVAATIAGAVGLRSGINKNKKERQEENTSLV